MPLPSHRTSTRDGVPLPRGVRTIDDVAERQLCLGCGACAYAQPDVISMADVLDHGRRPVVDPSATDAGDTDEALAVCPGINLEHGPPPADSDPALVDGWGPVLEVWEGHAGDTDVRWAGSSGGAATALALHVLAEEQAAGVLHVAEREDAPALNQTVHSTTRDQLLAATGSRYAPASPCDGLDMVRDADGPSMFIGKPCDVAATTRARTRDSQLDARLGWTVAIFCAGTPSLRGTLEMLDAMGVDPPEDLASVRYRGLGWPGRARASTRSGRQTRTLSYEEAWGEILQKHRQWRCGLCPDHTGEFADVSVGDPWYRDIGPDEPGSSLVVVRTERGRQLVRAALASGHLVAERVDHDLLPASQPNLLRTRGAVWGRLTALRLLGLPAPRFRGLPTLRHWWRLSLRDKVASIIGTWRRVRRRNLRGREPMTPLEQESGS